MGRVPQAVPCKLHRDSQIVPRDTGRPHRRPEQASQLDYWVVPYWQATVWSCVQAVFRLSREPSSTRSARVRSLFWQDLI